MKIGKESKLNCALSCLLRCECSVAHLLDLLVRIRSHRHSDSRAAVSSLLQ